MSSLEQLQLNRNLYRTQPQTVETLDASDVASNLTPPPSTAIASGNSVQDVNTNAEYINGAVIEPGTIPPATLDVSNWGWTQTCAFSVVDADTVQWGAGTFTSANGLTYSISGGNTGNMAALTYVYLDLNVSSTAYQVTTNVDTPVGVGKVLIAVCQNGSTVATYNQVQAHQIVGDNIIANTINASKITAGTITATQLSSTIIYAGSITIDTNGNIKGGMTQYNLGNGFFLGYSGGQYKMSVGDSTGNIMLWDGTSLSIIGTISSTSSGQRVVISGTSAFYYNASGTLIMATTASSTSFLIEGQQSTSSIVLRPGSSGAVAFQSGTTNKILYDPSANSLSPATDGDTELGESSFNWGRIYVYEAVIADKISYQTIVQPIIYVGQVSSTLDSISATNTSGWSATATATGRCTITHNLGTTNYVVNLTPKAAAVKYITLESKSSNSFIVRIANVTPALEDNEFCFAVYENL